MTEPSQTEMKEGFGKRLRLARKAAGYRTAKDFADKLEIDQNLYSPYESRSYIPKPATLWKFKQYLGITTDYLLFGDESALQVDIYKKIKVVEAEADEEAG